MLQIYNKKTGKFIGVSYHEDTPKIREYHAIHNQGAIWTEDDVVLSTSKIPKKTEKIDGKDVVKEDEKTIYKYIGIPLAMLRSEKEIDININCASDITGGFESNALGSVHFYQSEQEDQINLIGCVAGGLDEIFKCKNSIGVQVWEYRLHTATQLKQVLNDGKTIKQAHLQKALSLKDGIKTASSEELTTTNW